ncbi:MAG: DUF86 domain-containing protein [Bacillota bacterium]
MIDKTLIKQRLVMIETNCRELEELKTLTKEGFLTPRNSAAAESFLRRSLEAIFDIGRHILAKSGGIKMAKEYKSIAHGLANLHVVDTDLRDTLVKMAGYRNRMVHLYHQVTDEELYSIVQDNLNDLRSFTEQVLKYLNSVEP